MFSDREIRAVLRGAVKAGYLQGWYVYGFGAMRRYVISPYPQPTSTYTIAEATTYCSMLKQAGIDPIYRESEPVL